MRVNSSRVVDTAATLPSWPPLLTIRRAVAYSGCSRSTLGRAIRRGDLPLYGRAGGRGQRMVRREDLDRWLAGEVTSTTQGDQS